MFRPRQPRDGRKHDLEPRVSMGMFVGVGANNDVFVMTAREVVKAASLITRLQRISTHTTIGVNSGAFLGDSRPESQVK